MMKAICLIECELQPEPNS